MIVFNTSDVVVYLAPAGAGKTTALMDELVELLKVYRPDEVAFVTFTRKGVQNGIERALRACPWLSADELIHFQTLHAMCFHETGLEHKNIIERADLDRFNELLGFNVHLSEAFDNTTEDDKLLQRYDAVRAGCKKGAIVERAYNEEQYTRLVNAYEDFKKRNDLVDFYDCLIRFKERGLPVSVKVALIDEAQDLTPLQWEVTTIAFSNADRVRIGGDDFQCLFSYCGADPDILIDLASRYNSVKLERSFRLPRAVYSFARGITALIRDKVDKDFVPMKDVEGFVKDISDRTTLCRIIRDDLEKNGHLPSRWYLLFRNNCFIDDMARLLEQFTIPYHTAKGFCVSARDIAKIRRYYNYRKEGYSRASFDEFCATYKIADINEDFTESALIPGENRYVIADYVKKYGIERLDEMARGEPSLLLSTPYRVKGGEADYAVVFADATRLVNENATLNLDEELRVLYVSCTRAKLGLYLVPSTGRYGLDTVIDLIKEAVA